MRDLIMAMVLAAVAIFAILMGPIILSFLVFLLMYAGLVLGLWFLIHIIKEDHGPHDPDDPGP